jgi:hypothetical protein
LWVDANAIDHSWLQALQDVDVAALQRRLRQLGQLIDFMDT